MIHFIWVRHLEWNNYSYLWSVSKRTHEDDEKKTDVKVQEDIKHILPRASAKEVKCIWFTLNLPGSRGDKLD